MKKFKVEKNEQVISTLVGGKNIRSIERIAGLHRDTIMCFSISHVYRQNLTMHMSMCRFTTA